MSTPADTETRAFETGAAHLRAELERLDVVLAAHVDSHWRETTGADGTVTDEAVADYLADEPDRSPTATSAVRRATARLQTRIDRSAAAGRPSRLSEVADRVGLSRTEIDVLVAALAPALDPKYGRLYGYLQGDSRARQPTVGLVQSLFGIDPLAASPLTAGSVLLASGLLVAGGDEAGPGTDRPVTVPDRVERYLRGAAEDGPTDPGLTLYRAPPGGDSEARLGPAGVAAADRLAALAVESRAVPPLAVVAGREGTGRRDAALVASGRLDRPLLAVDGAATLDAAFLRAFRLELLLRDALGFLGVPDVAATAWPDVGRLLAAVDGIPAPVVVALPERPPESAYGAVTDHATVAIEFPRPSVARRREYWERQPVPDDADPAALAAGFTLPPGGIDAAMATADRLARSAGEALSAEHVFAGARAQTGEALAELAERIEPRYDWDDIVLPPDLDARLRETAAWLRHGGRVYEEWGFERRFAAGTGLTALFAGPSGTGKTMAAEVLAGDAGLELYRVDLSTVVDKYVGETESNLGRVFDAAADVDAVLLFDEADALFGSRSAVSDAQDRYANVEVNYLLQRIEAHEGPVVLTTNLEGNIDDAFRRRIDLGIDFRRPAREQRADIWRRVFPAETPVADLDTDYLSGFELTGGTIENVARAAAFLAADDDAETVGMDHVVHALRRELQKHGRLTTPDDFGAYADLVETTDSN